MKDQMVAVDQAARQDPILTEVDMRASMSKSWAATARRLSASLFLKN